jgi:hypothetical protein
MVWSAAADVVVVAVAVLALGVGVGEDVVRLVHPAARTAASITTANVPARNDFFMVNPRKSFRNMLGTARSFKLFGELCAAWREIRNRIS